MLRRLAILSTFYPYRGGIAQFNTNLMAALKEQNIDVKAFTFTRQYPDFLFPGKSQFAQAKQQMPQAHRVLDTINPWTYYSTARKIIADSPDFLLTRYWMPFFAPSLGTVSARVRRKGIKTIALVDNMIPHERRLGDKQLSRYFLKNHDGFVVMSPTVKADLLYLKPHARVIEIPHPLYNHFGVKTPKQEAREKLGIGADKKVVLFFGLIRRYKGLDLLIEAFEKLDSDYFLLIAGEPYEEVGFYEGLLKKLPQERFLFHPNYIPDSQVAEYFCAADICALPYKTATQSGVMAISLHFEIPMLVTRVGSLATLVEDFETGVVVEKPEVEEIRNAIVRFFAYPRSYQDQIMRAQRELSWQNFAKNLIAFCEQL